MQVSLVSPHTTHSPQVAAPETKTTTKQTCEIAERARSPAVPPGRRRRHRHSLFMRARARLHLRLDTPLASSVSLSSLAMASSSPARLYYLLLVVVLLPATPTLSSPSVLASSERRRRRVEDKPAALPPAVVVPGRARQEFHVALAPTTGPISRERRRSRARGGGTGAWTFSAMLPRGFVPPSGSSACHNDMPDTAGDAQFFACSGAGTP